MFMKRLVLLLVVAFLLIGLAACNLIGDVDLDPVTVVSISVDTSEIDDEMTIEAFDITDLTLLVTMSDGSVRTINVNESMISNEDIQKLSSPGTHTITIVYGNRVTTLTVTLVDSSEPIAVLLMAIYEMGVAEGEIPDSYEEWLASIRGEDGKDGKDGREIEMRTAAGHIQWRYVGETWKNLLAFEALIEDLSVRGIESAEINEDGELILIYTDESVVNLGTFVQFYTVVFKDHDGTVLDVQVVHLGNDAEAPSDPVREGHTFTGWSEDVDEIKENLVIHAEYTVHTYTITFDSQGGSSVAEMKGIAHGTKVTLPVPERIGYDFLGWHVSPRLYAPPFYSDYTPITGDITLYAHWDRTTYTVTFLNHDDEVIGVRYVRHGEMILSLPVAEREGHTFSGWDKSFDFITENMTARPLFDVVEYALVFHGTSIEAIQLPYGAMLPALPDVERPGHAFLGWFEDENRTIPFSITHMPAGGVIAYPKFELLYVVYEDFAQLIEDFPTDPVEVTGIVTSIMTDAFFMWDGETHLGVYRPGKTVAVGDMVRVSGSVGTWHTLTQINAPDSVVILSSDNPVDVPLTTISLADLVAIDAFANPGVHGQHFRITAQVIAAGSFINLHYGDDVIGLYDSSLPASIDAIAAHEGEYITIDVVYYVFATGMLRPLVVFQGGPEDITVEDIGVVFTGLDDLIIRPFGYGANPFPSTEGDPAFSVGVERYNPFHGVRASFGGHDMTMEIDYLSDVNQYVEGEYTIVYYLTIDGETHYEERTVIVDGGEDWVPRTFPTGEFSYRFADADTRHNLFASLEAFLLETMYGGVPLFANSSFMMYSDRLILPTTEYVPIIGYSALRGTLTLDDTHVTGGYGNEGEYTFRGRFNMPLNQLNPWYSAQIQDTTVLDLVLDRLYYQEFNDTLDGWLLKPSMAADLPQPIDAQTLPTGVDVANIWRVSIREDLTWYFHPDTVLLYPGLETTMDAHDFINTYRLAMDEGWHRAVSPTGVFLAHENRIVGAYDYLYDDGIWDDVGLLAVEDYVLEFHFENPIDQWTVMNWLSSVVMSPLHLGLYAEVEYDYGWSEELMAYHGPFWLDLMLWQGATYLLANPDFHDSERYSITGIEYMIISDNDVAFQEFLLGRLDEVAVPSHEYDAVKDDSRIRRVPGATTFRMMINALGTEHAQDRQFPTSGHTPEPILGNLDFRLAMYYAINREALAYDVMITAEPQHFLYTQAYMVDPASGISYRHTDQAQFVGVGRATETHGYDRIKALHHWTRAIEALTAEGVYQHGDTIHLELLVMAGTQVQLDIGAFIKDAFENMFVYELYDIAIEVTVNAVSFPGIYYEYMMPGRFDLGIGGISGALLNASSFMETFTDDNRSGFTLNWGIDTTSPNIAVRVYDAGEDDYITQIMSFNAIVSALLGNVELDQGAEAIKD